MKKNNLLQFGEKLKELRLSAGYSLREICRIVNYDPSNWSKIERGVISPPSDKKTLEKWAVALKIRKDSVDFNEFVDSAQIAQGIIPTDILDQKKLLQSLPAVFRTIRNEKPTKKEIDDLIKLIKKS